MPYRLSSRAEQDLNEVWSYVAEDASPTTADWLIDDLVNRFDLLVEQPSMGRLRPEWRHRRDTGEPPRSTTRAISTPGEFRCFLASVPRVRRFSS